MQMPSFPLTQIVSALSCSLALVACGPPNETDRERSGPINGSFLVSDYFTASGDMGDGEIFGQLVTDFNQFCTPPDATGVRPPRRADAQGDCYRFTYRPTAKYRWAGVYWQYPANSWGAYEGRQVIGPVDLGNGLHRYNQVTFYAAADLPPGATSFYVNFIVGGIDGQMARGEKFPYSDSYCTADGDCTHPFKIPGGFDLTGEMKQYTIDLSSYPLNEIIGPFAWSSNYPSNQDPATAIPTVIYIDDIVWE